MKIAIQRRDAHQDAIRRKELRARSYPYNYRPLQDGSHIPEKMTDRDPVFMTRAELSPDAQVAELPSAETNDTPLDQRLL